MKPLRRLLDLFRRTELDREMDEEMHAHLEHETKQNIARGMAREEARCAARRAFGGIDRLQEEERDARGMRWMDHFCRDLRIGQRMLRRSPAFSATVVLTLGLGIGLCTSSFSLTNAFLLRELPYPDSSRLMRVFRTSPQAESIPHSLANFADMRASARSFSAVALFGTSGFTLSEPGQPGESVAGFSVSAEFFDLLGVHPALGRLFAAGDDLREHDAVAVITHEAWKNRYGSDPTVVGRTVRLDSQPHTIVGVLPPEFDAPLTWGRPSFITAFRLGPAAWAKRAGGWARCLARLKPGVSLAEAQSELTTIAARLVHDHPDENAGMGLRVTPLLGSTVGSSSRTILWLTTGISAIMLLIACANLASLQLARAFGRSHEFAVRSALGGSGWHLVMPAVAENLILCAAGGTMALFVAAWSNSAIGRLTGVSGQLGLEIPIDWRVLAFTAAVSMASGIACGAAPAWFCGRVRAGSALQAGSRTATGSRGQQKLKQILTAGTLALALALVGVAASFALAFRAFQRRPVGWQPDGVLVGTVALPNGRYPNATKVREFEHTLLDRLSVLPGVEHAALCWSLPLTSYDFRGTGTRVIAEGMPPPAPGTEPTADFVPVSPGYFAALQIPLKRGEIFPADLGPDRPLVAVINESMAELLWPGENPIGRRIRFPNDANATGSDPWFQVVGVVGDVGMLVRFTQAYTRMQAYRSIDQFPGQGPTIVLRAHVPPDTLTAPVREIVAALDSDLAVVRSGSLRGQASNFLANANALLFEILVSAGMGLLIAVVGLYGVIAQITGQRTREIAVRIALGAGRLGVTRLILGQGLRLLLAGLVAGLPAYFGLNFLLHRAWPEMTLPGVWLLGLTTSVLALTTLLACWLPARRATRIDPMVALRAE
jgi:putative ABC transport system permease protein